MSSIAPVTSLVFIDAAVADYQSLLEGLKPGTEAIVLEGDGIEQITAVLASYDTASIASIHIVSHGSAGNVQLGAVSLNAATLDRYRMQLGQWRSALTEDADILLYGCDVARDEVGKAFIQQMSQVTGADVAASADQTGGFQAGGDWDLEDKTGEISAPLPFDANNLAAYQHILPVMVPGYATSVYASALPTSSSITGLAIDSATRTIFYGDMNTNGVLRKIAPNLTVSTITSTFGTTSAGLYPFLATDLQFVGGSVYASLENGMLVKIDTANGVTTTVATLPGFKYESGLAVKGNKAFITDGTGTANALWEYNFDTNAVSSRITGLPAESYSLEYDAANDKFYFATLTSGFYVADPTAGAFSLLSSASSASSNFAIDPSGQFLYSRIGTEIQRISTATGVSTLFMTGLINNSNSDLVFGPSSSGGGSSLYVANGDQILEISELPRVVTNTNDSGVGSLRQAILDANASTSGGTITFAIPTTDPNYNAGTGAFTITPATALPGITKHVVINGYSQTGATENTSSTISNAVLKIRLDGINAGANNAGLFLTTGSNGSIIQGLAFTRFNTGGSSSAIQIDGTSNHIIRGNFIGTDTTGTATGLGNNRGIWAKLGSNSNNRIGGTTPGDRNVIGGNSDVGILLDGGSNNSIQGNLIGLRRDGVTALGNLNNGGIWITSGASNNTIGGATTSARNIISGNNVGIKIDNNGSNSNAVSNNYIGTDVTGTVDRGNVTSGVLIQGTVSGGAIGNTIQSNLISGNDVDGIRITGSAATGNLVKGNIIGLDRDGIALANGVGTSGIGVFIISGASGNQIGGTGVNDRNIISGNRGSGVGIASGAANNIVQGNFIGTDPTGTLDRGNGDSGISIANTANTNQIKDNLVSGNASGILLSNSNSNVIENNRVGTDALGTGALGNDSSGIGLVNSSNNRIGGIGKGNTIANNTFVGLSINSGTGNLIQQNAIRNNGLLGIDLGAVNFDIPSNDLNDGDTGANNLQNFPVITSAIVNGANTLITGTINSTSGTAFNIELFSSSTIDYNSYGEGETYLGNVSIPALSGNNGTFTATIPTNLIGKWITATATNTTTNDTSEFSAAVAVTTLNQAPVLDTSATPTLAPIAEDILPTANTGTKISDLIASSIIDADGDPKAIAITGVDNTNGTWEYSTNGGTTWSPITTTSDNNATLLGATSFYTANLGTAPSSQSWLSYTSVIIPPTGAPTPAVNTETSSTGGAIVTTTADYSIYAGYSNYNTSNALVNANSPTLNNVQGYSLAFDSQVIFDANTNPNRASFSILLVSQDATKAIEIAFQSLSPTTGKIFAQNSSFIAAESVPYDTNQRVDYRVEVIGTTYKLFGNNTQILTGSLRDYGAFVPPANFPFNPYTKSNLVFLGDNTTSAAGTFRLSQVVVQTDNRVRYVPNANTNGNATISYRAWDATDGKAAGAIVNTSVNGGNTPFSSATETATITVTPVNDNPAANADTATTNEDNLVSISVLTNDSIAPDTGETLAIASVSTPSNGTAVVNGKNIDYTPAANFNGTDSFTYTIGDGNGGTSTATVTVTVTPVNDSPTATADTQTVNEDAATTSIAVLSNDSFAPDTGETLSITAVATPSNGGTAVINGSNINYTPAANFNGTDSFTYTISDGNGGTSTATVTVTVTPVNDAPTIAGSPTTTIDQDSPYSFTPTAADLDTTDTLTFSIVNPPTWATFNPATGQLSGTPTSTGITTGIVISVKDSATPAATAALAAFDLTVVNTNDAPTLTNAIADRTTNEDTPFSFTVPANTFTDPDTTDTLTYSVTQANNAPLPAWLNFNPTTRTFSGTPRNADVGTLDLKLKVTDTSGATAEDTFTLRVINVNQPPALGTPIAPAGTGIQATATQPFNLQVPPTAFSDPDAGDTLTLTATLGNNAPLPVWLKFDPKTGRFNGTPDLDSVGNLALKVTATDALGTQTSQQIRVTIANPTGITGTPTPAIDFTGGIKGVTLKAQKGKLLRGTRGSDILKGTKGNDRINSGKKKDSNGKDKVYGLDGNDRLISGGGNDTLEGGRGNDFLKARSGRDLLLGNDGNDRLLGGNGDDVLIGGNGIDTLTGGSGRDMFGYGSLNEGKDTIVDFAAAEDLIDLRSLFSQPQYAGATPYVRYLKYVQLAQVGSSTEIRIDADGSGAGNTFATLATLNGIKASAIDSRNFVIS